MSGTTNSSCSQQGATNTADSGPLGFIIGGAVGAVVVITVIIIVVILILICMRRKSHFVSSVHVIANSGIEGEYCAS